MHLPKNLLPRSVRPFDVIGQGLNSIDLFAVVAEYPARNSKHRLEKFVKLPGGQVATAMAACARLGWRARYVGRFGDDDYGAFGVESLERDGVDVAGVRRIRGVPSQFSFILVDGSGDRTVMWDRDPALNMTARDVEPDLICSGRVLHVDCFETEPATAAARLARASGMATVIDVEAVRTGTVELLREIDIIIAAEEFPARLTGYDDLGRALAAMADEFRQAAMVSVTLGARGSLTRIQGREIPMPAFKVPVVDTTGAGDVFRGAFIAAWLGCERGAEVEDLLVYATAAAGLKCRALGAREGIPHAEEVDRFLRDAVPR